VLKGLLLRGYVRVLENPRKAFMGPARRIGFDLSIMPLNTCRAGREGAEKPRWPNDALTDRDRVLDELVAEANATVYANRAGSDAANTGVSNYAGIAMTTQTRGLSAQSPGWTTGTTTPAAATTYPRPPFSTGTAGTGTRGSSADWKWIVGILITIAFSGIVGLVCYFWDPIVQFFTNLFTIVFLAFIIYGVFYLFSKR